MGIRCRIATALFALTLAGCGDRSHKVLVAKPIAKVDRTARYNATSEAAMFQSQEKMTAGMSLEDSEQLQADLDRHMKVYVVPLSEATPKDANLYIWDLMRPLHGLTATEIHAKVEAEAREFKPVNEAAEEAESLKD